MPRASLAAARAAQHTQLIRQIHTGKSWLKLDDDAYRSVLAAQAGGKQSSKDCSVSELQAVLEHLHRCGFPRPGSRGGVARKPLSPQQKKMWALWQALHQAGRVRDRTMRGLLAWIAGQTESRVQRLEFLTPAQEQMLIESLKKWETRDDHGR
ncbi:MAG: hypothetical protein AzoDbin1_05142 [Azoarcus sp.]|nr:hypothetical protein [Azoarcus sp.]